MEFGSLGEFCEGKNLFRGSISVVVVPVVVIAVVVVAVWIV